MMGNLSLLLLRWMVRLYDVLSHKLKIAVIYFGCKRGEQYETNSSKQNDLTAQKVCCSALVWNDKCTSINILDRYNFSI